MPDASRYDRIVDVFHDLWDAESRRRGEEYFRARRVELKRVEPDYAHSVVHGTGGIYAAMLEHERGVTWNCSCSCPYFRGGVRCKHLWALALALDAAGWRFEGIRDGLLRDARLVRPAAWRSRLAEIRVGGADPAPLEKSARQQRLVYLLRFDGIVHDEVVRVELRKATLRKNGSLSRLSAIAPLRERFVEALPDDDQRVISLLMGAHEDRNRWGSSRYRLDAIQAELLLPLMARTGGLHWARDPDGVSDPVTFDDGAPWSLQRTARLDPKSGEIVIEAQWSRGDQVEPLSSLVAVLAGGFVLFANHLGRAASRTDVAWARSLRSDGPLRVPAADKGELTRELAIMRDDLATQAGLANVQRGVTPKPRLRLAAPTLAPEQWNDAAGEITFAYEGQVVAASDTSLLVTSVEPWIERNSVAERALAQRPEGLGARTLASGALAVPLQHLAQLVRTLTAEGWVVEGEGARYRSPGTTRWSLKSDVDWFDLEGQLDFGGPTTAVPKLIAALRRGERTLVLDDGTVGVLPEDWLAKYGALVSLGTPSGGLVRFKGSQAWLIDALLATKDDVQVDERFRAQVQRLGSFSRIESVAEPSGFRGELRPYQREGLGWLEFLERQRLGGCLADDMGLGKTIQVLAWLLARRKRRPEHAPTLVVAPKSLTHNWIAEARRFAPQLSTLEYTGASRKTLVDDLARHHLVVTTYGTMRNDIELLSDERFDCVVLDESQAIKNEASLTAKAVRMLQAEHRLTLSGTPIENHLGELWSLFEFLNPGMLGRSSVFSELVAAPRDQALADESRALLAKAVRPFVLRRTKEQVLRDLPQKTEQTLSCELDGAARREYDELREHYRRTLLNGTGEGKLDSFSVLEALLRLRQAACHPGLIDPRRVGESSAKLDNLFEMIDEVVGAGHKALVFSQFTSFLAIVRQRLAQRGLVHAYLDGQTPARERTAEIARFQGDAACPLFLLSLKAGGVGLNLTAADYVFLLDPWWNPAVEAQAIGRAHRIGQTRSVFAYKLVCANTIEERVVELQARKRELAAVILDGEATTLRDLTRDDLEQLLR